MKLIGVILLAKFNRLNIIWPLCAEKIFIYTNKKIEINDYKQVNILDQDKAVE